MTESLDPYALDSRRQANERELAHIHAMPGIDREMHAADAERIESPRKASDGAATMGIKIKLPKAFVGLSVITVCTVVAILSPWIRDAWESFQRAEQSEKGPEYQKGMH